MIPSALILVKSSRSCEANAPEKRRKGEKEERKEASKETSIGCNNPNLGIAIPHYTLHSAHCNATLTPLSIPIIFIYTSAVKMACWLQRAEHGIHCHGVKKKVRETAESRVECSVVYSDRVY